MISLRRKSVETRPKLDEETKQFYREEIGVENPLSMYLPPGTVPDDRKARFFVLQCPHCLGVHSQACPKVKERTHYENGQLKRIVFYNDGEWDPESVVWLEDVFSD